MNQYFPDPYKHSGGDMKVELYLSSYARKASLKGETGIDTSMLASKTDLASLKTKVDNLDVKLKTVPPDLINLINVVKNVVVKKSVYN